MLTGLLCGCVSFALYTALFSTEIIEAREASATSRAQMALAFEIERIERARQDEIASAAYRARTLRALADRERYAQSRLDLVLPL